jgi:hypothetical protein
LEAQRVQTQKKLPELQGSVEALTRQREVRHAHARPHHTPVALSYPGGGASQAIRQQLQQSEAKVREMHDALTRTLQRSERDKREAEREHAKLQAAITRLVRVVTRTRAPTACIVCASYI